MQLKQALVSTLFHETHSEFAGCQKENYMVLIVSMEIVHKAKSQPWKNRSEDSELPH